MDMFGLKVSILIVVMVRVDVTMAGAAVIVSVIEIVLFTVPCGMRAGDRVDDSRRGLARFSSRDCGCGHLRAKLDVNSSK